MVKASRRVKRMKRSKKQVHRARGRKTNRRRYTRRQRGGEIITVCRKKGLIEAFASGIDITYDDETHLFKIGTRPTISDLETFNGAQRYTRALFVLKQIGQIETQLDWHNFALFALIYCHTYTHTQCSQIRDFLEKYSTSTVIDKNGAVEGSTIGTSINLGKTQFNSGPYKRNIEERFHAAPAPAAAAAPDSDVPDVAPNTLKVTMDYIAYRGHTQIVKIPIVKSTREYKFTNFTILLNDRSVITGVLDVKFVNSPVFTTEFSLSLNVHGDELFQCISECLLKKTITDAVTISTIKKKMMSMQINGTLSEKKVGTTASTYDFNVFVMKFAECHKECVELEKKMAGLSVAEPTKPTIKSIQSTLNTTNEHINLLTRNIVHKQTNVKEYPDPGNALNKIRAQAGVLQMSCNDLTSALMQPQDQAQLDYINKQAYELLHDVNELLAECDRIKHITTSS